MRVRKKGSGSSSHGHEWTEPGQVLDIPAEHAAELIAIAPHEFEALPDLDFDEGQGDEQEPVIEPEPEFEFEMEPEVEREPELEPEVEKAKPTRGRRRVTEA